MNKLKAWVSIMYGCDNFCTYCVVPYLRGRERSRHPDDIVREVRELANQGYKEVTLLGQNVNSYGKGQEGDVDFPGLLKRVNDETEIERIRFVTSHPRDLSDGLITALRDLPKVCESAAFAGPERLQPGPRVHEQAIYPRRLSRQGKETAACRAGDRPHHGHYRRLPR